MQSFKFYFKWHTLFSGVCLLPKQLLDQFLFFYMNIFHHLHINCIVGRNEWSLFDICSFQVKPMCLPLYVASFAFIKMAQQQKKMQLHMCNKTHFWNNINLNWFCLGVASSQTLFNSTERMSICDMNSIMKIIYNVHFVSVSNESHCTCIWHIERQQQQQQKIYSYFDLLWPREFNHFTYNKKMPIFECANCVTHPTGWNAKVNRQNMICQCALGVEIPFGYLSLCKHVN